jgi:endonuclease/exonuclease/phosphatase family metal-dependent hydrolase
LDFKGGIVIKLDFRGTSLVFVSSHLAAHTQFIEHRNADYREIVHESRKHIGKKELDILSEFDHVLWMGDLNYRIDLNAGKEVPPYPENDAHHAEVCAMVERKEWEALSAADQLRHARETGKTFAGFEEGDSHFAPSYKVDRVAGTK